MAPLLALLLAQLAGQPGAVQTPNAGRWTSQQGTFLQSGTGAWLQPIETKLRQMVSATDFCFPADVNGTTDNTTCVQNALNSGGDIFFPGGTYLINADSSVLAQDCMTGGVAPLSNSSILLAPDAILKAKANSSGTYCVLRLLQVSNVSVRGGTIDGNRAQGTGGGSTQHGFGIGITGSTNVVIDSVTLQNNWGDGIVIDQTYPGLVRSSNILINNVVSNNNRRQGLSIVDGTDILVQNSVFSNTNGVAPQDGIDVEPGTDVNSVSRVIISGCSAKGNLGHGISLQATSAGTNVSGVNLTGNTVSSNSLNGITVYNVSGGVSITGNYAKSNTQIGIYVEVSSSIAIDANHSNSNTLDGIAVAGLSSNVTVTGNEVNGNVRYGMQMFDTGGANVPTYISFNGNTVQQNQTHGIVTLNAIDSAIANNIIASNSQATDNTSDGILITTSSRMTIHGNTIRKGAGAKKQRYGLNLNSATDTRVVGNDFLNAGGSDVNNFSPTRNTFDGNSYTTPNPSAERGTCTLASASPSTCTATVYSGAVCMCSNTTTQANPVKCAVSGTTMTATGPNTVTDVIAYRCF